MNILRNKISAYLSLVLLTSLFTFISCKDDSRLSDVEQSVEHQQEDTEEGYLWTLTAGSFDDELRSTNTEVFEKDRDLPGNKKIIKGFRVEVQVGDPIYTYGVSKDGTTCYYLGTNQVSEALGTYDRGFKIRDHYPRRTLGFRFKVKDFSSVVAVNKIEYLFFTTVAFEWIQPFTVNNQGAEVVVPNAPKSLGYWSARHFMNRTDSNGNYYPLPLVANVKISEIKKQIEQNNNNKPSPLDFHQVCTLVKAPIFDGRDLRNTHDGESGRGFTYQNQGEVLREGFNLTLSQSNERIVSQTISNKFFRIGNTMGIGNNSPVPISSEHSHLKVIPVAQYDTESFKTHPDKRLFNKRYDINGRDDIPNGDYKELYFFFFPPAAKNQNGVDNLDLWKTEEGYEKIGIVPQNPSAFIRSTMTDVLPNNVLGYHTHLNLAQTLKGNMRGLIIDLPLTIAYIDFAQTTGANKLYPRFDWYKGLIISSKTQNDKVYIENLKLSSDTYSDFFRSRYNAKPIAYKGYDGFHLYTVWGGYQNRGFSSYNERVDASNMSRYFRRGNESNGSGIVSYSNKEKLIQTESQNRFITLIGNFTTVRLSNSPIGRIIAVLPGIENEGLEFVGNSIKSQSVYEEFVNLLPNLRPGSDIPIVIADYKIDTDANRNIPPSYKVYQLAISKGWRFVRRIDNDYSNYNEHQH